MKAVARHLECDICKILKKLQRWTKRKKKKKKKTDKCAVQFATHTSSNFIVSCSNDPQVPYCQICDIVLLKLQVCCWVLCNVKLLICLLVHVSSSFHQCIPIILLCEATMQFFFLLQEKVVDSNVPCSIVMINLRPAILRVLWSS